MSKKSGSEKAYKHQAGSAVAMIVLTPVLLVANLVALPFTSIFDAIKRQREKKNERTN
jgi:hypothetical protein